MSRSVVAPSTKAAQLVAISKALNREGKYPINVPMVWETAAHPSISEAAIKNSSSTIQYTKRAMMPAPSTLTSDRCIHGSSFNRSFTLCKGLECMIFRVRNRIDRAMSHPINSKRRAPITLGNTCIG